MSVRLALVSSPLAAGLTPEQVAKELYHEPADLRDVVNGSPSSELCALVDFDHRAIKTDFGAFRRNHDSRIISRAFFENLKALFD